jgi:hypothetical protein
VLVFELFASEKYEGIEGNGCGKNESLSGVRSKSRAAEGTFPKKPTLAKRITKIP